MEAVCVLREHSLAVGRTSGRDAQTLSDAVEVGIHGCCPVATAAHACHRQHAWPCVRRTPTQGQERKEGAAGEWGVCV